MRITTEAIRAKWVDKVSALSGQNLCACYQCGKCSAGCPSADRMDHIPSQFIKLAQLGLEEELRRSNTPWICLTCFVCSVRCPKGIDIASIMEAARVVQSRDNVDRLDVRALSEKGLPPIALVSCFRKHTAS